jgi:hypothetical protein
MREQGRLVHFAFELWLRSHRVVFVFMGHWVPLKNGRILGEKDE